MSAAQNRFDFLRLFFAFGVFAYHSVTLTALDPLGPLEIWLGILAEVSVQGFFIISGLLVFGSWQRSQSLRDYAGKRVRRLYPAYAAVILVPAAVALVFFAPAHGGVQPVAEYVFANLIFLNFLAPDLPGLFVEQRFAEVNGALWTLKIEVMFYLVLPVLALAWRWSGRQWWLFVLALYLGAGAWQYFVSQWDHPLAAQLARQLPGQLGFFAFGMALWQLRGWVQDRIGLISLFGFTLLLLSILVPQANLFRPIGLAGLIAGAAYAPGPQLPAAAWGDISYGVYITHFPILQTLLSIGLFSMIGWIPAMAVALALVVLVSYLLWYLIEKPALRPSSHYRAVSTRRN